MKESTGSCWDILFWTLCTFVSWTHFKWVSSKAEREKPQSVALWPLGLCGQRGVQEAGLVGPPRSCGSGTALGRPVALGLGGSKGRKCCPSSALQPKGSTRTTSRTPREPLVFLSAQLWSSCSPLWAKIPLGFAQVPSRAGRGVQCLQSPHVCEALFISV